MKCAKVLYATFALVLLLSGASSGMDDDASGEQIFLETRKAVDALPQPDYIVFTFRDNSVDLVRGRAVADREQLRVAVRRSDGHAFVQTLATKSGFQGSIAPVVVGDNGVFPDTEVYRLGDFPLADFGLRNTRSRVGIFETETSHEPTPTSSPLRTIGTVSVINIPYRIVRLSDEPAVDGPESS